jgi:hypothetical protein
MAERKILQARGPFTVNNAEGVPWQVRPGDLYWSDDPVVVGREELFAEPEVRDSRSAVRRSRQVPAYAAPETAVAPPSGEKRAPVTSTGRKAAAKSGARPEGEV